MNARSLQTLGLVLSSIGGVILAIWAIPSPPTTVGAIIVENGNPDPEYGTVGKRRAAVAGSVLRARVLSKIGFVFLAAGFVVQIFGIWE